MSRHYIRTTAAGSLLLVSVVNDSTVPNFLVQKKTTNEKRKDSENTVAPPPSLPTLSELHQGSLTSTSRLSLFPHVFFFWFFVFFSRCRFCILKAKLSVGPETHVRG